MILDIIYSQRVRDITYTGLTRSDRERDIVLKQATCIVNMECILDIKNPSYNGQFQLHRNIWNCSVTYFSTVNNIQRVNVRVPLVWLEICICICFLIGLAILQIYVFVFVFSQVQQYCIEEGLCDRQQTDLERLQCSARSVAFTRITAPFVGSISFQ